MARKHFTLRVKAGSEIDNLLTGCGDGEHHTKDELIEIVGVKHADWIARKIGSWFDNVAIDAPWGSDGIKLDYIEVTPQQVIQHIEKADVTGISSIASDQEAGEIVWPEAPPLIKKMDNFVPPAYCDTMSRMVSISKHVSLSGPPGVGKSTSVEQMAADEGVPLVNIGGDAGLRKRDLVGSPEMVNGTTKFFVSEYAAAVVNGWWVKIDEINAADPDAVLFLNGQLAPPYIINIRGQQYPVHPRFRLFVTYNPGLVGTKPLPPSFKDRFYPIKQDFPTDYELRRLLKAHGLPDNGNWSESVIEFARKMYDANQHGQMRYQISPRRLIDAIDLMNHNFVDDIKTALRMAVVATIDSPLESRVAEEILRNMEDGYGIQ